MQETSPAGGRRRGILIAVAVAAVVAIAAGTWWFFDYTKDDGRIYPNVMIFGENFGGKTPQEAAEAIHAMTDDTYTAQDLLIQLPDQLLYLTPADTGASLDVQKLVDAAYGYGRQGNRWQNKQARIAAETTIHEPDVLAALTLNREAIQTVLDEAAGAAYSTLTQPAVTVTGEVPDRNMSYEAAMAQEGISHQTMTITLGTPDRTLDTGALLEKVLRAYSANRFEAVSMDYTVTDCQTLNAQTLLDTYGIKATDAVLDTTNYTASQEILGYGFDAAALQAQLDAAAEGETLTVPFTYINAAQTKAGIESQFFCDILGEVSTNHTSDSNRNTNLKQACKALNGYLIRPGETFSYNAALGQRTTAKGYKPAGAYSGGKNVETVGGGICQVSSTLYYACLKADLEIVERTNHGFMVSYMPYGMDATVSWGSLDYKFRNNTYYPIRIKAWVSGGQVHIQLLGTDTKDYYVKMVYDTIEGPVEGKTVYEDYKYNNKEGYKDGEVIQTAYTGRTVKTYRVKYSKATDEKLSSTYEATSRYKSRDKIIARVEAPPAPPVPTTEPTEATNPG